MIMVFNSLKTASNWRLNETKLLISSKGKLPVQKELNTIDNMLILKQISLEMMAERFLETTLLISYASLLLKENKRETTDKSSFGSNRMHESKNQCVQNHNGSSVSLPHLHLWQL